MNDTKGGEREDRDLTYYRLGRDEWRKGVEGFLGRLRQEAGLSERQRGAAYAMFCVGAVAQIVESLSAISSPDNAAKLVVDTANSSADGIKRIFCKLNDADSITAARNGEHDED